MTSYWLAHPAPLSEIISVSSINTATISVDTSQSTASRSGQTKNNGIGHRSHVGCSRRQSRVSIPANPERWSTDDLEDTKCVSPALMRSESDRFSNHRHFWRRHSIERQIYFLKGISNFEEAFMTETATSRRAYSMEDARQSSKSGHWAATSLDCPLYPQRLYDPGRRRMGILLWCEVPVYWGINWQSSEVLNNARNQLTK